MNVLRIDASYHTARSAHESTGCVSRKVSSSFSSSFSNSFSNSFSSNCSISANTAIKLCRMPSRTCRMTRRNSECKHNEMKVSREIVRQCVAEYSSSFIFLTTRSAHSNRKWPLEHRTAAKCLEHPFHLHACYLPALDSPRSPLQTR